MDSTIDAKQSVMVMLADGNAIVLMLKNGKAENEDAKK